MTSTLAVGDAVWISVVALIGTILTPIIGVVTAILLAKINSRAEAMKEQAIINAELVEEVKIELADRSGVVDAKLDELKIVADDAAKTGKEVKELVNGNTLVNLRALAVALRQVAMMGPTPEREAAADEAERILAEHEAKLRAIKERTG